MNTLTALIMFGLIALVVGIGFFAGQRIGAKL